MKNSAEPMCPILVIEGIDGSGKGTQAKFVSQALNAENKRCTLISFPRYSETFFGARIGDFLNGEFGTLDELNPFLVSLLYSGDRFESLKSILQAQKESDLVVLDRYVPSNIAHQSAKYSGQQRGQLKDWIENIEYEIFGVPRPHQVVLLDTPVEISQNLIAQKSTRDYTDQAADLQEEDVPYLSKVREVYLELAAANSDWSVVPVSSEGQVRSIETIGQEVLSIARSIIQ